MKVVDYGHVYRLPHIDSNDHETLTFIKRSSESIQHETEHPGTNCQEVIRALIDRVHYLYEVLPCDESADIIYHLRMALFGFEARAYRRKQGKVNKKLGDHISFEPDSNRNGYDDVPFSEYNIEDLPVGPDGHIMVK